MTFVSLAALAGVGGIGWILHRLKVRSSFSPEWHNAIDRESWRNTHEGQSLDWAKAPADFAAYRERTRA